MYYAMCDCMDQHLDVSVSEMTARFKILKAKQQTYYLVTMSFKKTEPQLADG